MIAKPLKRCVVYTRKSTDEGMDQDFTSIDAQFESGCAYIASQQHEGWVLQPDRFDDPDYSGGSLNRPALKRLMSVIESGQVTGDVYSEGIETVERDGVKLRVYGVAKTVADCFKHRNKIGLDVALEALKDVRAKRRATADDLWRYAKVCRVANIMRPYLEAVE